jgi:hypothetical protein
MAALMDDGEDQDLLRIDQEVDDVGEPAQLGTTNILACGTKLGGTLGDQLEELSGFGDEVTAQSCPLAVIPGCGIREVAQSLLPEG